MTRTEAFSFIDEGQRLWNGTGFKVTLHSLMAEGGGEQVALAQCANLGGEGKSISRAMKIEGLDAQWITGKESGAGLLIPECEGKHASKSPHTLRSLFLVKPQDDFGIGGCVEHHAACLQLCAQFVEVVDFTVVSDRQATTGNLHWLMACRT